MIQNHEIDYKIYGEEMQYVEVELDPNESAIAEPGAFMMMEDGIQMETIFGDGTQQDSSILNKLFQAGKRALVGESLFMTAYTNTQYGKKKVSFASPYPGKIIPMFLPNLGGKVICQKDAFLCAAMGTKVSMAFNRRLGAGFFGGEGFILEKLEGDGMAFIHAGGSVVERELKGETLRVDTGCIVGFTPGIDYSIERAGGLKSMFFGGEGLFLATLKGNPTTFLDLLI